MKKTAYKKPVLGFTLVELLVSIGMFAILIVGLMFIIDPVTQLEKLKDSQKKHDLEQIRNAMDQYYSDHNCYPVEIPFGEEWKEGEVMYMKEVPSDQDYYCRTQDTCYPIYYYQTDTENICPQWAVLYTHLYSKNMDDTEEKKKNCPLWTRSIVDKNEETCTTLITAYNYCFLIGQLDCSIINGDSLPGVPSGSWLPSTTTTEGSLPTTTTISTTTSSSTTTTTVCDGACSCLDATTYWGNDGFGVRCQLLPEENRANCGTVDYPCYCSNDCMGCPCTN